MIINKLLNYIRLKKKKVVSNGVYFCNKNFDCSRPVLRRLFIISSVFYRLFESPESNSKSIAELLFFNNLNPNLSKLS